MSIEFSCERDPQFCLCPPRSGPTASCLYRYNLTSGHFRRPCQNVPIQSLHVGRSARSFLADSPPLTSTQNPPFQDLTITKREFCCWACNLFICSQRVNFFELFTKCLQNRFNQIWRIRVQQRSLHLRIHPVSLPNSLRVQVAL